MYVYIYFFFFFFQAEDGIRDLTVTGVQTCALPILKGNGCGGVEVAGYMYINSGGSPVNVSSTDPHHPALYGFDVYRFPVSGYSALNPANTPQPARIFSKSGRSDSHGIAPSRHNRYLWVMDRHANVAEIIDVASG